MLQLTTWRKFPGHNRGRGNPGGVIGFLEFRRWRWGYREAEASRVQQAEYWNVESCAERSFGELQRTEAAWLFSWILIRPCLQGNYSRLRKNHPEGAEETLRSSLRSGNCLCIHHQEWQNLIVQETSGRTLSKVLPGQWGQNQP